MKDEIEKSLQLKKQNFAKNFSALLQSTNITIYQFSTDCNIKYKTACSWVNGTNIPNCENLNIICKYFSVSADDLFSSDSNLTNTLKDNIYIDLQAKCNSLPYEYHKPFLKALKAFVNYLNN